MGDVNLEPKMGPAFSGPGVGLVFPKSGDDICRFCWRMEGDCSTGTIPTQI